MARLSSGLILHRSGVWGADVMLVHPGGPFWARRDTGAWSIPKGEYEPPESPLAAARREFAEETGLAVPGGTPVDLGVFVQPSGKRLNVWALAADLDVSEIHSNTFELEWPRGSGRLARFPEVDRAGWFDLPTAAEKLTPGQRPVLEALVGLLG